ncbi:MAG TPA: ABC transporter permease [Gaiellaceae bacterium]|jgi:ribose transport system permease protein
MSTPTQARAEREDSPAQFGAPVRFLPYFDWRQYVIYIVFAVIFAVFAVTLSKDGFLNHQNLLQIVEQTAMVSVEATAMTFVIAAAEIDLSIGSVAGLASVVTALALGKFGLGLGILAGIGVGVGAGVVNGGLVTVLRIPSFLVTLGMLGVAEGVARWVTNESAEPVTNGSFIQVFGGGSIGTVSGLVVWTLVVVAAGAVVLRKTAFGRQVFATGGNRIAAEYSGVSTQRIKFAVLLLSGLAAALAGMLYAGRLQSGRFDWGSGDELSAIAATILGGTSLFGGGGSVVGALFGSLMIGLINNGLILAGFGVSQQEVIQGVIIIFAVALGRRK